MKNYRKIIGVHALCNFGGLVVLEVSGEKITTGFSFGNGVKKVYTTPIKFDNEGSAYFTRYGVNYFLSDIMRV